MPAKQLTPDMFQQVLTCLVSYPRFAGHQNKISSLLMI